MLRAIVYMCDSRVKTMNAVTPTKVSTVSVISRPKSPKYVFVVRGSYVTKSDWLIPNLLSSTFGPIVKVKKRRSLLRRRRTTRKSSTSSGKVWIHFCQTHISCRSCRDKAAALINNLQNYKKQFSTTNAGLWGQKSSLNRLFLVITTEFARLLFDPTNTESKQVDVHTKTSLRST